MRTDELRYDLPDHAIAQEPAQPRHAARLLDADRLCDLTFDQFPSLLRPNDLVVVNSTRVRAARLRGAKHPTGGSVEALLLRRLDGDRWEALLRPARRLGPGTELRFGALSGRVLTSPENGQAVLELKVALEGAEVEDLLEQAGEVPLPPYIHRPLADPDRYQTIFAKVTGSAAAPTAGLHFTPRVLEGVQAAGAELADVDLEVGLDTFWPITSADLEDHRIHRERFRVPEATAEAVATARRRGGRVIAVGTTSTRALESAAGPEGFVEPVAGETGLYIVPGYRFRVVDALLTNFHAPGSTLLALLAAFMGHRWRAVYAHALAGGYRFLSFGDAMFVRRSPSPSRGGSGRG
jgi:S-adenosylmethionine:tRNA ribosyltransferase-isomerase